MAQHAEFAPPRVGERGKVRADTCQPDQQSGKFQGVGHSKAAIKNLHRKFVDLIRVGNFKLSPVYHLVADMVTHGVFAVSIVD